MKPCSQIKIASSEANNVVFVGSSVSGPSDKAREVLPRRTNRQLLNLKAKRKLLNAGSASLTALEVLQLVLNSASSGSNNASTAEALLREFGTFGGVINAPACKLMAVDGVGATQAMALKIIEAATYHILRKAFSTSPIFSTDDGLKDYLLAKLRHNDIEVFYILYLDSRNRLIGDEELWRGTIDRVKVYPRDVVKRCLELGATSIIIAHNHPDGSLQASLMDVRITKRLVTAAAVFGIHVLDHVIVTNGETLSLWTEGLM